LKRILVLKTKKNESLIRFFISLGFPTVVEEGDATTEPLIAIAIPLPGNIPEENLPGRKYFGDRNIRAFKVSDISTMVTTVNALFASQSEVDGIAIKPVDSLSAADFIRLERLRVLHGFLRHLKKSPPLVSAELINALGSYEGTVSLNSLSATMVDYFVWRQEAVSLVSDDKGNTVPVFTGGLVPPSTGEDIVASEIIRKLSIQLGTDPITAVDSLTSSDSFLFQFIADAIREGMNRSNAQKTVFVFPKTVEEARALIRESNAFKTTRDAVARGLIAAFPPKTDSDSLYGQLLSETSIFNAKSAIFFITFLAHSHFQVDSSLSFLDEKTSRPRLDNSKFLAAKDSDNFTLIKFVTSLLSLTEFSAADNFTTAENLVRNLGSEEGLDADLYELPIFKKKDIPSNVSKKSNISASLNFSFFDNRSVSDIGSLVSASVIPVTFGANGPVLGNDAAISGIIAAITSDNTSWKITFSSVPSDSKYLVSIKVTGRTYDVPNLFFFADGFADPLLINGDRNFIIPADEEFFELPCLGILANQKTISGANPGELMGVDFSNVEENQPPILPVSLDGKNGALDLRFSLLRSNKFSLDTTFTSAVSGGVLAPLYVNWSGSEPTLSVKSGTGFERLANPKKALGLNFLTLISSLSATDLTSQVVLTDNNATSIQSFLKDGSPTFLLKDRKGLFWMLAVKNIDNKFDPGFADICFIRIGVDGKIKKPNISKPALNAMGGSPLLFINLNYGDFAHFPSDANNVLDITKWGWSAPKEVPFGFNSDVASKAQIRYAGEDFINRVGTGSEAEILAVNAYIKAGDFTSVPSRLDYYGPVGGGLAVLKFDTTTLAWPTATGLTFTSSVSSLVTGDLVFIRMKSSGDADIVAMVDKKTKNPAIDNFRINLLLGNYTDSLVQVAGALVDIDKDGYIAKFDPNDKDPNIKPSLLEVPTTNQNGTNLGGASQVTGIFASENGEKFIFVDVQENVNEVYQFKISVSSKHSDGSISDFPSAGASALFEFTPADFSANAGEIRPTGVLKTGASLELADVGFENFSLDLLTAPSMFTAGGVFEPGSKVIFSYEFTFRPRDSITGLPISNIALFGTNPVRPILKGSIELLIPPLASQVGDFDKTTIFIQQGVDTPATMADAARLEPQKDISIIWGAVANANFYEVSISFESVSSDGIFLPHFRSDFTVDANNRKIVIPAFKLPQGRSGGNLQIIARRKNALGQPTFDGTVVTFSSLSTTGEAATMTPGGVNDIRLKSGSSMYYHASTKIIDTIATDGQLIFSITPNGTSAQVVLGSGISAEGFIGTVIVPKKMAKSAKDVIAAGATFTATPGTFMTFMGIVLSDGSKQPIDVNFSGFRTDEVVVQAFLPPPFKDISSGGSFDVDNDLITDVTYDGASTLTFTAGITVYKQDVNLGRVLISTASVATIFAIPVGTLKQDFELETATGKKFWFFIDLAVKTVQWGEIFGGNQPPMGAIFSGSLKSGDSIDFDSVLFKFSVSKIISSKNVVLFNSGTVTSSNGWALSSFASGTEIPMTSIVPIANDPKVYRIKNSVLNMNFDINMTLFASGELTFQIMPPDNSGGGANTPPPPADPFTTNTFVFDGNMVANQFLSVTPVAPFTFTVSAVSGANTAFSFSNGIVTPTAGWVLFNEFNTVITSITPTVDFAKFFRAENSTAGVGFSGFMKLVGSEARIGVMNVNSFGGSAQPPFTGLFETYMEVDKFLTVNDNGTTATFFLDAVSSNTLPLTTLFKFSITNEIKPQNGWLIEIFNGTSFVPASGSVFASSTSLNTKFKHPSDLRTFNIDFKLQSVGVNVRVQGMFRGTLPPPPPPPGILVDNGQYFNHIPGTPTTFAMSPTLDTNALVSESVALWNGSVVTGSNSWQIFDLGNALMASITPTVGGIQVFFKNSNPAVLEAYKVKLTLSAPKVAFEVIQIIPITPPPAGTDVADTMFFNYKPGSPAVFVTSGASVMIAGEESIFQFSGGQILQANSWGAFDATGINSIVLPLTPTVAVTTLVFKKAGTKIKVDVNLVAPNLHVVVVNVMLPPPMINVLDTNFFKYIHGTPASFISSPVTVISGTEETIFQFSNSTSQIIQDNGWSAFDITGVNTVSLPFTATVAVTTLVLLSAFSVSSNWNKKNYCYLYLF
jgi:hypothetical protein